MTTRGAQPIDLKTVGFGEESFGPGDGVGQLTYGRVMDVAHCSTRIADQVMVVCRRMPRYVDLLAVDQTDVFQDLGRA